MAEKYHLDEWASRRNGPYVPSFLFPLEMKDHSVFLDLGCGSGYFNAYVSAHLAPAENIGIDSNPATIELAKKLNAGNDAVKWMCAAAESIPLPDASVDYIVCRVVVPYVHVDAVFGEIARILKPGGKVVLSLHPWTFYLKWPTVKTLKGDIAAIYNFLAGGWFNLTGLQCRLRWGNEAMGETWQTESRMRKMLGRRGITPYRVESAPEFIVYSQKDGASQQPLTGCAGL